MTDRAPETHIGFLIHDVARLMRADFDERSQDLGLTRAQWRVLVHLGRQEGVNQRALAEILEIDNVSLGRHIDRLETAGWLERRPDPRDRRAWRIYLTETARPSIDRMGRIANDVQSAALDGLDEAERAQLMAMLERVKTNVSRREDTDTDTAAAG